MQKYSDAFSIKYSFFMFALLALLAFAIIFLYFDYRGTIVLLLLWLFIGFLIFHSYTRKVIISENNVIISPSLFSNYSNVLDTNRLVISPKATNMQFMFSKENIKSAELLESAKAKTFLNEVGALRMRISYLANAKNCVLIRFKKPLRVALSNPLSFGFPERVSLVIVSVKDNSSLIDELSKK
jgi:hypothetical protein